MDISLDPQIRQIFKRSTTKAFTEVKTTPVVLVCIYNKNGTIISHDLLHTVFSTYGKILRILIFEKMKVWKAFIEFDNLESAIEAKRNLDDFLLFSDGSRMNIYFSNLETIKFQNSNAGGVDYTVLECQDLIPIQPVNRQSEPIQQLLSKNESDQNIPYLQSPTLKEKQKENNDISVKSSATTAQSFKKNNSDSEDDEKDEDILKIINRKEHLTLQNNHHEEDYKHDREDQNSGGFDKYFESNYFHFNSSSNKPQKISSFQEIPVFQQQKKAGGPPPGLNIPKFNSFESLPPVTNYQPQQQQQPIPQVTKFASLENIPQPNYQPQQMSQMSASKFQSYETLPQTTYTNQQLNSKFASYDTLSTPNYQPNPQNLNVNVTKFNSYENLPNPNYQPNQQPNKYPSYGELPQPNNKYNSYENLPQLQTNKVYSSFECLPSPTQKYQSYGELPQANPNYGKIPQSSSMTTIPNNNNPQMSNYSSFRNSNYQSNTGSSTNIPQPITNLDRFNKPNTLNPKFHSTPEISYQNQGNSSQDYGNQDIDLNKISQQGLIDLIERDIMTKIFKNFQSMEVNDQNPNNQLLLQEINKNLKTLGLGNFSQDTISQISDLDYSNMDKNALTNLHNAISLIIGKSNLNTTDTNKKSQVLYVKGLEHEEIRVQMLYNIFSNFGNLLKIIFIRPKAAALLEFENAEYSTISKDFLNNIVFMGKPLRIYYSNYPIINLRNKKSDSQEEIFIGKSNTFRFKKTKSLSINPPSATLHISNLVKEVCREDVIRGYFSAYGRIEAVKFLFMDGGKNMCHLKMASIEESLNAMAYLHDTDLGGRKIQISFTRTKI